MITWYIIGIVMFVLQVYILKHTYSVKVRGRKYSRDLESHLEPIETPMFVLILIALCTAIPYAWIVSSAVFWIVWTGRYCNPELISSYEEYTYWRLRDEILMKST